MSGRGSFAALTAPIVIGAVVLAVSIGGWALLPRDPAGWFASSRLAGGHRGMMLAYVLVYEAACAVFWPTPSEAPLLLFRHVPLWGIILVSCAGKACGAYIVCRSWRTLDGVIAVPGFASLAAARERMRGRLRRHGFAAYFLMQAIPFMPMRTSLYVYASLASDWRPVVAGAAVGTACRDLLMLAIVLAGYLSWRQVA